MSSCGILDFCHIFAGFVLGRIKRNGEPVI